MRRARLSLDALERRDVPATFGIPWANPTSVTVSFAPDGADVDGKPSELFALMTRSGLSQTVWQREIWRAFQAWTAKADLNTGVVNDSGDPLGTNGHEQADSRFGDIRIFAVPLSSSVLAITTPPGDLAGTRTGDIILNSNYNFGVGTTAQHDLYTVLLQESGHAFGVGNSPNRTSVMYEFYQGTRSALAAEDVSQIQKLYSARPTRTWEPSTGNDAKTTATPLNGSATQITYGDLASAADQDWYSFVAPADRTASVQVQTSGLSLLAARVSVLNPSGTALKTVAATKAGQDLSISLTNLLPGAKYYVRVLTASGTPFAAGQYRLRIAADEGAPEVITLAGQAPVDDAGTNESFLTATRLGNYNTDGTTSYRTFADLRSGGDIDVYRVRSPYPGLNQANVLTATVRAFGDVAPQVTVKNLIGLPVPASVVADGNGLYTVVVSNAAAGVDFNIEVRSRTGVAGDYEFRTGFRSQVTSAHQVDSGLLTILNPSKAGTLAVTGSAQIYFRLSTLPTPVIGPSVVLRVYDSSDHVVFQLLARTGEKVDGVALLGTGQYRVDIRGNSGLLPSILTGYTLETALLTDPTGVTPADPNNPGEPPPSNPPPPPPPSGYNYYNDRGYYVWGEQTPSGSG